MAEITILKVWRDGDQIQAVVSVPDTTTITRPDGEEETIAVGREYQIATDAEPFLALKTDAARRAWLADTALALHGEYAAALAVPDVEELPDLTGAVRTRS